MKRHMKRTILPSVKLNRAPPVIFVTSFLPTSTVWADMSIYFTEFHLIHFSLNSPSLHLSQSINKIYKNSTTSSKNSNIAVKYAEYKAYNYNALTAGIDNLLAIRMSHIIFGSVFILSIDSRYDTQMECSGGNVKFCN